MKQQEKYLYISAGKGPAECEWVVGRLLDVISKYLKDVDVRFEIVNTSEGRFEHTYKSVQMHLLGMNIDQYLSSWIGTIQWIGKSKYRFNHKRTNWFVSIDLLDVQNQVIVKERDLIFSTYKASGPGGQHRNKVESAVKVIHIPSGFEAISSDSRSQHQNKMIARKRLLKKIEALSQIAKLEMSSTKNQMNNLLVRGNPVKVFRGDKFKES